MVQKNGFVKVMLYPETFSFKTIFSTPLIFWIKK